MAFPQDPGMPHPSLAARTRYQKESMDLVGALGSTARRFARSTRGPCLERRSSRRAEFLEAVSENVSKTAVDCRGLEGATHSAENRTASNGSRAPSPFPGEKANGSDSRRLHQTALAAPQASPGKPRFGRASTRRRQPVGDPLRLTANRATACRAEAESYRRN